jgi:hypothetical protein
MVGIITRSPVSRSMNSAFLGSFFSMVRKASHWVSTASCRSFRSLALPLPKRGSFEHCSPYRLRELTEAGKLNEPRVLDIKTHCV